MTQRASLPSLADARIAIVGGGHMGKAILAGLLGSQEDAEGGLRQAQLVVATPGQATRQHVEEAFGVACVEDASQLPPCEIVVLAVRPAVVGEVLDVLAGCSWMGACLLVSVAAGVPTGAIEAFLPAGARVVRAMPNMPLSISMGATGVCAGASAGPEDLSLVCGMFALMGDSVAVDETLIDAVTAVSGSGPAYVAALVDAMADAGVQAGLEPDDAQVLARATAEGTAAYMRKAMLDASTVCDQICVPGGTTEAAMSAMEQAGFSESIHKGVQAAIARAQQLGA